MTSNRFDSIQLLRGIAATLVVLMHALHGVLGEGFKWNFGDLFFSKGLIGVDIFFVISGFIIYYIGLSSRRPTVRVFLENRFWRIYPPYWAVLLMTISMSLGLAVLFEDASKLPSPHEIIVSIMLIPAQESNYVIGIAWTLSLELVFYAVFALTALRYGTTPFFGALLVWYALAIAGMFISNDYSGYAYPVLNPVVLEFLYGALIARFFLRGGTKYHEAAFILGALAIVAILLLPISTTPLLRREFVYGIPSAFLVFGAIGLKIKWSETVVLWGDSSYMLYLLHLPLFLLAGRGIRELSGFNVYSSPLSVIVLVAVVIASAMAVTKYFERPYQRAYKARLKTR